MNALNKRIAMAVLALGGMVVGGLASANPVTMTFDELNTFPGEYVHNYYNAGCGSYGLGIEGTCGGPDYGVEWKGAAHTRGKLLGTSPSSPNFIQRLGSSPIIMNVAAGFSGGFSFDYSSRDRHTQVTIWGGLNGTGNRLATTGILQKTPFLCHEGIGIGGCWSLVDDLDFAGIARSVTFDTPSQGLFRPGGAFDNITFEMNAPVTAVPEPAVLGIFSLGVLLVGLFAGRRRLRFT